MVSDAHGPTDPPVGGPSWMRNRTPGVPGSPTVATPPSAPTEPPALGPVPASGGSAPGWPGATAAGAVPGTVNVGSIGLEAERVRPPKLSYSRHAITPLPYAGAALAAVVALLVADRWATSGTFSGNRDSIKTLNQVWFTVDNLLLAQLDDVSLLRSTTKGAVVLVLAGIVAGSIALWVARLGRNLPLGESSFGVGFALLALPAWWTFPMTVGLFENPSTTRIDALMRLGLAAAILSAQFLLLRWALLNKIWRSGRLPGDLGAIVLWLPELIPWMLFLGSSIFTLAGTGDGEAPPTAWRPTPAMVDWGQALSKASAVGILVLLVVVSVRQHLGMIEDRRRDQEARDADRRNRAVPEVAAP